MIWVVVKVQINQITNLAEVPCHMCDFLFQVGGVRVSLGIQLENVTLIVWVCKRKLHLVMRNYVLEINL